MKRLIKVLSYIWTHPLASQNRRLAFKRFFKFHLVQKILPYPLLYPFVENSSLLIKKGMAGATGNIYTGLLEFHDMAFLLHVLRSEDVFVDIGANIGVYTILAAKNVGARVLSIEPIASTFINLTNNVQLNGINHLVTLFPIGVGENNNTLNFTGNLDTVNHVLSLDEYFDKKNVQQIEVKTIDEIVSGNEPVFMKMDVEGFEWPALLGAKSILASDTLKGIIIELNGSGYRYGYSDEAIHDLLLSYKFKPYKYDPFSRKITPLDKFGPFNTIYLKDKEWAVERVKNARNYRILNVLL